jgi:hypothetical protein
MATKKDYGSIQKSSRGALQPMVEEKEAESYEYVDKGKETVVPHTSRTGGIQGVKSPYPEITYRKFEGEALVDEKQLNNIKKDPKGMQYEEQVQEVQPVPLGDTPLEEPSAPSPELRKTASTVTDTSVIPAVSPFGVTPDQLETVMRRMFEAQRVPPPTPVEPPKSMSVHGMGDKKPKDNVTVTFQGPFGEVTAPFANVIDGDFCVALVQNLDNQFNYNPPISDNTPIQIEWMQRGTERTQTVVHAGLTFKWDGKTKVLILLKS